MRLVLFAALAGVLSACGQTSDAGLQAAAPEMASCLAGARQEAKSNSSSTATEADVSRAAGDFCSCAQRILLPADFAWLKPVFDIAALDVSSQVKAYRLEAHLSGLAGAGPVQPIQERLDRLGSLLTSECPAPRVDEAPAAAATATPEEYYEGPAVPADPEETTTP